jgi:hypothetical protein
LGSIQRFPAPADSPAPLGYSYPPPFTRYEAIPAYHLYPLRTVGVLFFTQNGIDYRCSASSIGNHAIWTAGHCVSDGAGNWSYNLLYIPGYKDGQPIIPGLQWAPEFNLAAYNGWHLYGDLCYDMGVAGMQPLGGVYPVSVLGWLGFAWNWPRDQHWFEIGYPSQAPFDGNRMMICASSHSSDDDPCVVGTVPTQGAGCDQTPGCSGGPWIKDFSWTSGSTNYLNGNFSYHYIGLEDEKFSPYFDDLAKGLWDFAQGMVP